MDRPSTLIIRGDRVLLPGGIVPARIHVRDGRIAEIQHGATAAGTADVEIVADGLVMPGLVDSHVHINDPGRADWEGFDHATRAAAAGGVTTLVDMPLNSIPATTTLAAFDAKRRAADRHCHVDVACWGGIVPGNERELEPLARAGVRGFKCFLSPSGVDEFQHVTEPDLRAAFPIVSKLGLPVLAHAEWPARLVETRGEPRRYETWLHSRPPAAEQAAIELLIRLSREFDVHVHIVHLANADALAAIVAARANGVRITCETCPHYLTFAAEDIADGATAFKCAPPIRGRDHRERLWRALADGTIDLVATDHSPAPPAMKRLDDGDFMQAWGGIASLQISLAAVWSGARARGIGVERLAEWMSAAPARLAGLDSRKGSIQVGYDADFVIWDPDAEFVVDASALLHRHPITPYDGRRLYGQVGGALVRGVPAFIDGRRAEAGHGRIIDASVV